MLAPEDSVCPGFAGGAGVQHVIQTQLAIIAFLCWEVSRFNDPQLEHIVHPSAVILELKQGVLLLDYNSPYLHQSESFNLFRWCDEITDHIIPVKLLHWENEQTSAASTLLGLTARCRFSIHLSLSDAERQAKHFVPELVVTWGDKMSGPCIFTSNMKMITRRSCEKIRTIR